VELVTDYLRAKHLLIILDNCEHLIEASARLAEGLLKACPGLKIIASSREALGIPGETTYRVPSLFLPEQDKVSHEALLGCEAVQLFVERARSANQNFDLTEGNAASVAQICLRLDGIPLALELAAARVRVLAVEQIAERLGDRFRLLTGGSRTAMPRQQTLRALIDWSYDLLTDSEKAMFRRLAVFVGGWTLEAAEAVCSGDGVEIYEVLDLLAQLVDKSLVIAEENDDAVRYHRLETIRQYAREKLLETDEAAIVRDRHLDYFIELARSREKENLASWFGEAAIEGVADDDNIRSALSWALESQPAKAMELAAGSVTFWSWIMRGYIAEIRDWCQTILSRVDSLAPGQVEPTKYILGLKAQTWNRLSQALMNLGDHQASKSAAEKSVELAREANDQQTLAEALGSVGIGALYSGDPESALKATEESIQICIARGYKRELVWAYNTMTHICRVKGDETQKQIYLDRQKAILHEAGVPLDPAEEELELSERALFNGDIDVAMKHAETGLAILSDRGDKYRLTNFQSHIAHILRQQGRFDEALNFYRGAIRLWQDFGHRGAIAHQLECFGLIALAQEQSTRAAMLFSAAEALRETVDSVRTPAEQKEFKEAKSKLQSQMGGGEFNDLWNEGRSITMEQAIALALEG